jgi:hypothetical protein
MSLGRFILTVLLASMLAGCASTAARDRTTAEPVAHNGAPTVQRSITPAAGQAGNEASLPPRARKRPEITAKPSQVAIEGTRPLKKPDSGASPVETVSIAKNSTPDPTGTTQMPQTGAGDDRVTGVDGLKASPGEATSAAGGIEEPDAISGNTPAQAMVSDDRPPFSGAGGADNGEAPTVASPPDAATDVARVPRTSTGDDGVDGPKTSPGEATLAAGAIEGPGGISGSAPAQAMVSDDRPAFSGAGSADNGAAPAVVSPPDAAGEQADSPRIAMLSPGSKAGDRSKVADLPKPPSFGERSLDCDVIELMGKSIGRRHIRGEPR